MNLFFGIVEDIKDPRELGRVRVRVHGIHTHDKVLIPVEGLPWATVMQPTTSAANSGIGTTPRLTNGSLVVVMFADQHEMQFPIILGSLPSEIQEHVLDINGNKVKSSNTIGFGDPDGVFPRSHYLNDNDLPKLARNTTVNVEGIREFVREPESFKNSLFDFKEPVDIRSKKVYPYNQVRQTQAGHYEEWDDTPGNERVNRQHSSGTFEEWRPDGTSVVKVFHDRYTLVLDSDNVYIGGNVNVHINGDSNLYVQGNQYTHVAGNQYTQIDGNKTELVKGNVSTQVFGNVTELTQGNTFIETGGSAALLIKGSVTNNVSGAQVEVVNGSVSASYGNYDIYSSGGTNIDGGIINLNSEIVSPLSTTINNQTVLTPLISKEYDLEFVKPLIDVAGRFAAFDEEEVIDQTPGNYPEDTKKPSGNVREEKPAENKSKPEVLSCENIGDKVNYSLQLSNSFTLANFTKNMIFPHALVAQQNMTTSQLACNLKQLAVNVAEPIHQKWNGMRINSAFRKGSGKSQHEKGMAMDIQWPGISNAEYLVRAKWIAENIPFDQLIFEHGNSIWIHLSFNSAGNRKRIMTMFKGKYETGMKLYY
jgi:hypothetical protein